VIYVTLSDSPAATDTAFLEETIRAELTQAIPARFNPVYLKFRRSAASGPLLRRAQWLGQHDRKLDRVCEPKNIDFKPTPVIGMSIGPEQIRDAASLGGFVRVGGQLYAMSALRTLLSPSDFCLFPPFWSPPLGCFLFAGEGVAVSRKGGLCAMLPRQLAFLLSELPRQSDVTNTVCWTDAFKKAIDAHHFQVLHPAELDLPEPTDHNVRSYDIGSVSLGASSGALRRSLTFQGMDSQEGKVEMDWYVELEFVDTPFFFFRAVSGVVMLPG
jgi:hypothetical protein